VIVLALGWSLAAGEALDNGLRLHAPFDGEAQAAKAAGDGAAQTQGCIMYRQGRRNKGMCINAVYRQFDACSFKIEKNFNPKEGTIALWVCQDEIDDLIRYDLFNDNMGKLEEWEPAKGRRKHKRYNYLFSLARGSAYDWTSTFRIAIIDHRVIEVRLVCKGGDRAALSAPPTQWQGKWRHVALTFRSGGRVCLYVDGAQVAAGDSPADGIETNACRLFAGSVGPYGQANAVLDDLRVYGRALSAAEIKSLYGATQ